MNSLNTSVTADQRAMSGLNDDFAVNTTHLDIMQQPIFPATKKSRLLGNGLVWGACTAPWGTLFTEQGED